MAENDLEPVIVSSCCNWCAYTGADAAGTARVRYPPNVHITRAICIGMIHSNLVVDTLNQGADEVLICGCHPGDRHSQEGNKKAELRAEAIWLMLDEFGLQQDRFRLKLVSAA